ncbi:unnamed protein product [Prorocentrum cordatum]|uniref:Uncharacterized protein n=1 Tax=Prorocentrum cordatum TaxID=2364126 RepID=A0ABN9QT64_9DINO|nr:unnamed protein product [Polarella glacialis]
MEKRKQLSLFGKGTFKETRDEDGDICYIKNEKYRETSTREGITAEVEKSSVTVSYYFLSPSLIFTLIPAPQNDIETIKAATRKAINTMNKLTLKAQDYSVRCKADKLAKPTKDAWLDTSKQAEAVAKTPRAALAKRTPDKKEMKRETMNAARLMVSSKELFTNKAFFKKSSPRSRAAVERELDQQFDQRLDQTANYSRLATRDGSALADYVWSVDVAGEDDDAVGIVFRVADTHNFYKYSYSNNAGGCRTLYKVRNGVQSELWHASTNESYGNGREYTLQVRTDGCRFVGHYRGGEDFDVTDRDCVAAGGVGAYSWGSGGQWSNMLLATAAGRVQGRRMDPAIAQVVVFGALLAACCAGAFCCLATRYNVARPASSSGLAHGKLFDGVVGGCGDQHELSQVCGNPRVVPAVSWAVDPEPFGCR